MEKANLQDYLTSLHVTFRVIPQPERVYTAQEIAAAAHIPGRMLAKSVMIKIEGMLAMAVLPASHRVNFYRLREDLGIDDIELATEAEFKDLFPECEVGAMPPLGNIYGLTVIASKSLTDQDQIAFCGGTHRELIQIAYQDFERLTDPKILDFSYQP